MSTPEQASSQAGASSKLALSKIERNLHTITTAYTSSLVKNEKKVK